MRPFSQAFLGGFLGKLAGAVFLAICATYGFGPDEWVRNIWPNMSEIVLVTLRGVFLVAGAAALFSMWKHYSHSPNVASWLHWPFGYIPIDEAARIAYQRTQDTHFAGWADACEELGDGSVLGAYAKHLGQCTSVRVSGIRPHMEHREEISKAFFNDIDIEVRDGLLIHRNSPSKPLYTRLAIRRQDLAKAIEELKHALI